MVRAREKKIEMAGLERNGIIHDHLCKIIFSRRVDSRDFARFVHVCVFAFGSACSRLKRLAPRERHVYPIMILTTESGFVRDGEFKQFVFNHINPYG